MGELNGMQRAARELHGRGLATIPIKPDSKVPATRHGVYDATCDDAVSDRYYERHPDAGIGVSGAGLVIFDFDRKPDGTDGMDALHEFEREHGELPETLAQTTPSGGLHMVYRHPGGVRPSVNAGIAVDVRGEGSYVVCDPTPGYAWCGELDEIADADERVMAFLERVRPAKRPDKGTKGLGRKKSPKRVREGGRNDYLFRLGRGYRAKGYEDMLVASLLQAHNLNECDPPLPEGEVERTAKSACSVEPGKSDEVMAQMAAKRGRPRRFDHAAIAEKLMADNGACMVDGMPAIRTGGRYRIGWDAVSREIIALRGDATRANQHEVHHYISVMCEARRQSPPHLIAFGNGVLDTRSMELRGYAEDDVIPNVIPHAWDPDAECPEVDAVLDKMACRDADVYGSLIEVMGSCMYRSSEFTQSAILLGAGSNGKSTYIRMLQALLGRENVSSLDMAMIGKQFHTGQLAGKLANLGDDISNEFQRGDLLSMFKKVVDGDRIYTDVKGTEGFEFEPYATLVFSANEFPRLADYTDGMMRRIFPVEFNATFSKSDADYDPRIARKVTSEAACRRMCVLGVLGLKRMLAANGFTPTAASGRRVEEIRADNDTVLAWALDAGWDAGSIDGKPVARLYQAYREWCADSGLQAVKRTKFTRGVNARLGTRAGVAWVDGGSARVFERAGDAL